MPTSADIIAEALHRAGVRHAFGIPGGEVLALIDALERAGIRYTLARHENPAGFMAEAAYRATGAPGVLVATVGPGLANGLNAVANAQQERAPLIVLTGRIPEAEAIGFTHQVFDHRAALAPFVKAGFEAREGACDLMIDKALSIAMSPRPGPVHVDLPIPVATAEHPPHRGAPPAAPAPTAPAQGPALDRARAMLAAAERPVIVAGLDLLAEDGAAEAVREVSARLSIPVMTTYKAKGALPEGEALCLLGHGLSPKSDREALPILAAADLVIAAGYDPIEMRAGWRDPWDPARCIAIAHAPNDHFVHREGLSFVCGVGPGLRAIAEGATPRPVWPGGEPAAARARLIEGFGGGEGWGPAQALHVLNRGMPEGAVATVDSGAHRILMSQIWTCAAPGALMQSTGLCTMGVALPMATGFALADGGRRPVVAVMGDGCLDMVLGELATLRDCGGPVVAVVLVDASYALIELKQRREGFQSAGTDFGGTDYAAVAAAVGLPAETVQDAEGLEAAFAAALARGGPGLIAVKIPRRAYDGLI